MNRKDEVAKRLLAIFGQSALTPALADEWDLALDSVTDEQVSTGLHHLRVKYTGRFIPKPGEFLSWCRARGEDKSVGVDPERIRFRQVRINGIFYEFALPAGPARRGPLLSNEARKRRKAQLADLMVGKLDGGLTLEERIVLAAAQPEEQSNPAIIALRNKQRAALGWPLLAGPAG